MHKSLQLIALPRRFHKKVARTATTA